MFVSHLIPAQSPDSDLERSIAYIENPTEFVDLLYTNFPRTLNPGTSVPVYQIVNVEIFIVIPERVE